LRCLLDGYNVTLNGEFEAGTSVAGNVTAYQHIANFQATDPNGNGVTSPAGLTATINWGDGTSSQGVINGNYLGIPWLFEIDGDHAFPNPSNGEYTIRVTLTDPDGGDWYGPPSIATIDPRPDELNASPVGNETFSVADGQALKGEVATLQLNDPSATVTGLNGQIINQRDGTTTPADIVPAGPGSWDVYDSEDFKDPGPNDITIEIADQQGDTTFLKGQVTVTAPLTLGNLSPTQWHENQPGYDGTISGTGGNGGYQNRQVGGLPAGLGATILSSTVNGQQRGTITISGAPTQSGTFTLMTSIEDGDGDMGSGTESLTITAAPPLNRGRLELDADRFIAQYKRQFAAEIKANGLSQTAINGLKQLIGFINQDANMTDVRWVAYMLATAKAETSRFQPVSESPNLWKQHDRFDKQHNRWDYGHPERAPNGTYQIYYGRGYAQLTWESLYLKLGKALQIGGSSNALANDPSLALVPQNAYKIMSYGMIHGSFTGRGLSRYINGSKTDYYNARKIINGLDRAPTIAGYAQRFEAALRASMRVPE